MSRTADDWNRAAVAACSLGPAERHDVDQILHWIANEMKAPQGAARWLTAYEDALARLEKTPHQYPPALESEDVPHDLRQILFRTRRGLTYRAVFIIENDDVFIVRVRGSGQPDLEPDELGL